MKKQITVSLFLLICTILADGFIVKAIATQKYSKDTAMPFSYLLSENYYVAAEPPDLSKVVLTVKDLPPGFEDMSDQAESFKKQLKDERKFKPESVFAFQKSDDKKFQLILGFTMKLATRIEQASFDSSITKEDFSQYFLKGLNERSQKEFTKINPLPLGEMIGEASAGWVTKGKIENLPVSIDIAIFRRQNLGAFLVTLYIDGDSPSITIADIARKFDSRIVQLMPPASTQPQ